MSRLDSRFSCVAAGMERLSLDLSRVAKNIVGCRNVWKLEILLAVISEFWLW